MNGKQHNEEQIFHVARMIEDPEARSAYLNQICADNLVLRERVEALLATDEEQTDFLKSNDDQEPSTMDHASSTEQSGTNIGRYKLMEQIGEGGMGTVFVAQQDKPIRRKVALKVIKPGMDSKAVIARFEAERQALAMMDHPNIAKVLDAGTTESGHPYFAMELVKGVPITAYCDRNKLAIRERLELFIQVCQAIQHAHQKGIIHRDIKPSNVLVTLHDGKPVPKVIDFGVAKALNTRLTDKTIYTAHFQIVGTLLYMSPEQAELSGLDVDTRSDVYSLGVLLYELLTGTTPFQKSDLDQAGFDEQRRLIREKEPPRASVRVSSLGETATNVAKHRQTDAKKLSQLIRKDLDWILHKSLDKDRTRRYDTATGFAADVKKYLEDEPVGARPPSIQYRSAKFIKRNRLGVGISFLIVLLLGIGIVGIFWQWRQAQMAIQEKDNALENLKGVLFDHGINHAFAKNSQEAEKALNSLRTIPNASDSAMLLEAFMHISNERPKEAIKLLEDAVKNDPQSVSARALLTYAYEGAGFLHLFFQSHLKLKEMEPQTVEELFFAGMTYGPDPQKGVELIDRAIEKRDTSPVFYLLRGRLKADWAMQSGRQDLVQEFIGEVESDIGKASLLGYRGNAGAEALRALVCLVYAAKHLNNEGEVQRLIEKATAIESEIGSDWNKGYWNRLFLANLYYEKGEKDRAHKLLESAALDGHDFAFPFYFFLCFELGEPPKQVLIVEAESNKGYAMQGRVFFSAMNGHVDETRQLAKQMLDEGSSTIDTDQSALAALLFIGEDWSTLNNKATMVRRRWAEHDQSFTALEQWWFDHALAYFESTSNHDTAEQQLIKNANDSDYPSFHLSFANTRAAERYLGQGNMDKARNYYDRVVKEHLIYSLSYWRARAMLESHPELQTDQLKNAASTN